MANRSYLYATDHLPGLEAWEAKRDLQSIAEWNYDIPLTFKLLLSGNPMPVRSSIWETDEKIALAGEAPAGLEHLMQYLARLPAPAAPLVAEAQDFLSRPENIRRYFVLECGEIFEMQEGDLEAQNLQLSAEARELPAKIDSLSVPAAGSTEPSAGGLLKRLFGGRKPASNIDPQQPFYSLGLGNWSNILYFQFAEAEA